MANRLLIALILVSTAAFAANVALSGIAGATEGVVFKHRTGDVSKRHETIITPIGWTFFIWNLIFLFVGATMTYLTVNLCRSNVNGLGKIYCNPAVFSRSVAAAFILNQIFYVSWLFVWDNENMTGAAVLLFFIMITNWIVLGMLSKNLSRVTDYLSSNAPVDLATYRILVQNSFGMYTAWTTLAFILNANVAAIHDGGMSNQTSSITSLSILTAVILLWAVLSLTVLDRYVRYMLTPLLTLAWGLMGVVVKLKKQSDSKSDIGSIVIFVTVLLGLTVVLLLVHITTMVYRHRRKPLYVPSP